MQFINQFSLLVAAASVLIVLALLLRGGRLRLRPLGRTTVRVLVLGVAAVALLAGWFAVRPTATPAADVTSVRQQIGAGLPVLLELQSPF